MNLIHHLYISYIIVPTTGGRNVPQPLPTSSGLPPRQAPSAGTVVIKLRYLTYMFKTTSVT